MKYYKFLDIFLWMDSIINKKKYRKERLDRMELERKIPEMINELIVYLEDLVKDSKFKDTIREILTNIICGWWVDEEHLFFTTINFIIIHFVLSNE